MSIVRHAGQSAGIQHIELNGVSLGARPPVLQLDHGIQIPIASEIMQPVAQFMRWGMVSDDDVRANSLPAADGVHARETVTILRADYPAPFYVASTITTVDSFAGNERRYSSWPTAEVWDLEEIADQLDGAYPVEYWDEAFRREVKKAIQREGAACWGSRVPKLDTITRPSSPIQLYIDNQTGRHWIRVIRPDGLWNGPFAVTCEEYKALSLADAAFQAGQQMLTADQMKGVGGKDPARMLRSVYARIEELKDVLILPGKGGKGIKGRYGLKWPE